MTAPDPLRTLRWSPDEAIVTRIGRFQRGGQTMRWEIFIPAAIGTVFLISALVTGRALNPFRGMSPLIVRRKLSPVPYWWSVALNVLFTAVGLWIALAGYFVKS